MTKGEEARIARMKEKIADDPALAFRVLRVIWARQKPEEKFTHRHMGHDGGRGFTPSDTPDLNALYERFEGAGFRWQDLRAPDVVRCCKACRKYAKQYLEHERERREQEVEESRKFIEQAAHRERAAQRQRTIERWGPGAVVE